MVKDKTKDGGRWLSGTREGEVCSSSNERRKNQVLTCFWVDKSWGELLNNFLCRNCAIELW